MIDLSLTNSGDIIFEEANSNKLKISFNISKYNVQRINFNTSNPFLFDNNFKKYLLTQLQY